jgi:hypothetical protein
MELDCHSIDVARDSCPFPDHNRAGVTELQDVRVCLPHGIFLSAKTEDCILPENQTKLAVCRRFSSPIASFSRAIGGLRMA